MPCDSSASPRLIVKAPLLPDVPVPPVQISNDEVIIIGEDAKLWRCNVVTTGIEPLGLPKNYQPWWWLRYKKILLCYYRHTLYEVNVIDKSVIETSVFDNVVDMKSIDKDMMVIYCTKEEGFLGKMHQELNLYFPFDGKRVNLEKNILMNSFVYVEE